MAKIYKTGNAQWLLALATAGASWSHAGAGFLEEVAQEPRSQPLVVEAQERREIPRSWLRGPLVLPDVEPELVRRAVVGAPKKQGAPRSWLRQPAIVEEVELPPRPWVIAAQAPAERSWAWLRASLRIEGDDEPRRQVVVAQALVEAPQSASWLRQSLIVEAVVEAPQGRPWVVSVASEPDQRDSWLHSAFVDVEAVVLRPRPLVVPPEVPIEQARSWLNASFVDVTEVQPEDPPPSGALAVRAEPRREQPRSWYRSPPLGPFDSGFYIDGRTEVGLNAFGAITVYADGTGNFYEISSPSGI